MKYQVVYAPSATGYGAYVPNLPTVVGTAATLDELKILMEQGIEFRLEDRGEIPNPTSTVAYEMFEDIKYVVVFDGDAAGFDGFIPDFPKIAVRAPSLEEARVLMHQKIKNHLDRLREAGKPIPEAATVVGEVEISVPA